jgi:hypothetical protein
VDGSLSDITGFVALVHSCFENINAIQRRVESKKIMEREDWHELHIDGKTGRRVLSHFSIFEHPHERRTAIMLTQVNYDVIFHTPYSK